MKFNTKFLFILFSLFYVAINYIYLLDYPLGIHFIRQTDSISFILYYLNKSNFNLLDVGNLSLTFLYGKTSCEFPIVYYICFIIFKVFGIKFGLIRWFSLLFSALSIYYLLKATSYFIGNAFLAISLVLLIISSTVYRYYSINFLPDSFSIACVFITFYHFFKFTNTQEKKSLLFLFVFGTLAALIKVYYGIYIIAITLYLIFWFKVSTKKVWIYSLAGFVLVGLWYGFSLYYNLKSNSTYYLMHTLPLWELTEKEIDQVIGAVWNSWYNKYYLPTLFHTFLVLAILLFIPSKTSPTKKYSVFLLLCLAGCICYFVLFFKQLRFHDYYFLPLLPFLYLLSLMSISKILKFSDRKIYSIAVTLILAIIAILGFNYTSLNLNRRFEQSTDKFSIISYQLRGINEFMKANKIPDNAKFIVIGDLTVNGSLVFLNRFGWTYHSFQQNLGSVKSNLPLADYLLILKPSENPIPKDLDQDLSGRKKIASFKSNDIYSLRN